MLITLVLVCLNRFIIYSFFVKIFVFKMYNSYSYILQVFIESVLNFLRVLFSNFKRLARIREYIILGAFIGCIK